MARKAIRRRSRKPSAHRAQQPVDAIAAARAQIADRLTVLEFERAELQDADRVLARLSELPAARLGAPASRYEPTAKGRLACAQMKHERRKTYLQTVAEADGDVHRAKAVKVLADGPLPVSDFVKRSGLSRYLLGKLVAAGAVIASGATNSRRVSLPGQQAKEAP